MYWLEQGIPNPRDNSLGFRHWQEFDNIKDAKREAKRLEFSRILEVKDLGVLRYGKPIKEETDG